MIPYLLLTNEFTLIYNHFSSNSFPVNQTLYQLTHQVFTHKADLFLSINESENEDSNRNDRTISSLLPQVRGLVHYKGPRESSCHMPTVQEPALAVAEKIQDKTRKNRKGELTNFPLLWRMWSVEGWFKIHRQIRDNYLYQKKPFDELHAWIDMIARACFETEKTVIWRGSTFEIKRGEFIASSRELGEYWGWSKDAVIAFQKRLKRQTMIQTVKKGKTTLISIINFETYQSTQTVNQTVKQTVARQSPDSRQTVRHDLLIVNKEGKERKEVGNGSLSEKSREPEAEPVKVRAKAKLVI